MPKAGTASRSAKRQPKGDYEVGYAKPPSEHRFKPGNNANPRGRRKGTKNRKVVIEDVLLELVTVRQGGQIKQMPRLQAVFEKLVSEALAGDKKAAALVMAIAQKEGLLTPEQEEAAESFSDSDAAVLEAFRQQFTAGEPNASDTKLKEETDAD